MGEVRYPKRLVETDLPIRKISEHARREKSIRHGHISTLHIWWARRPLAACRAVMLATLLPDPADPDCPPLFREAATTAMEKWRAERGGTQRDWGNPAAVRAALLDFIADFANWDNSTNSAYIALARWLVGVAHEGLGGTPGTRPLVADPFAGGGAIPLEALRVGADAFASDLNPVAVLLNKVALCDLPDASDTLVEDLRRFGIWVKEQAEIELSALYPSVSSDERAIAYLWARTIHCEGPGCGVELPLIRSLWLSKRRGRRVALRLVPSGDKTRIDLAITTAPQGGDAKGIVRRGSASCPCCGYTTPAKRVREQLFSRRGGSKDARLLCVVTTQGNRAGRLYRLPTATDLAGLDAARQQFVRSNAESSAGRVSMPNEPTPEGKGKGAGRAFSQRNYGMTTFADLYTERQLVTLTTLARIVRDSGKVGVPDSVRTLLAFALSRVTDLSMTLCRWLPSIEATASANGGQNRMPVVLDFVETNPFGGSGGDWLGQVDWVARVVRHLQRSQLRKGTVVRAPAQNPALPDDACDVLFTDPPYYDAFPYSDLSDFFLVWLRRVLGAQGLDYSDELSPKDQEAVVYDVAHGGPEIKDKRFFQREMTRAFRAWRGTVKPCGVGVVVFANKTTEGWEALIESLIDAGWMATASWPIDTERPNRQRAIGSAALGSSVHVICRPREDRDGSVRSESVGDWRGILTELPVRIHEWLPRLANEGVVGADAIFACLGPALEIFSRYARVEKAAGDVVSLREYLEHVWAVVAREALSSLFRDADVAGLESDARLTSIWLWTLKGPVAEPSDRDLVAQEQEGEDEDEDDDGAASAGPNAGFALEFDAARKIAQGLGARLGELSHVVEVVGERARLLSVVERTKHLFGRVDTPRLSATKAAKKKQILLFEELDQAAETQGWGDAGSPKPGTTTLDRLHQSMLLFGSGRGEALKRFIVEEGVGRQPHFWKLAQSLSALYPGGTDEKRWVDGVLARKKGLGY